MNDLTASFLVAASNLKDPIFNKSVIFIFEHEPDCVTGVMVNRPWGKIQLKAGPPFSVFYGGPMDSNYPFLYHGPFYGQPASAAIKHDISITAATKSVLADLSYGRVGKDFLLARGACGWTPDQLEGEIALNIWSVLPFEKDLLFSKTPALSWQQCHDHLQRTLGPDAPLEHKLRCLSSPKTTLRQ